MHHNSVDCDSSQVIKKIEGIIDFASSSKKLFPKRLKLDRIYDEEDLYGNLKANGGWADIRDHLLCLNMTIGAK